jgi:hypothetical protein
MISRRDILIRRTMLAFVWICCALTVASIVALIWFHLRAR